MGDALTFGTAAAPPTLNPATGDPAYGVDATVGLRPADRHEGGRHLRAGPRHEVGLRRQGNKVYELTFRGGVKFSDGTPLNAEAVKTYLDYERTQKTGRWPCCSPTSPPSTPPVP